MKAITRREYGGPERLVFDDVEVPTPAAGEVLVKVEASSVNPYDWHLLRGEPYVLRLTDGVRRPKSPALGLDLAGTVAALGDGVRGLAVGDEVFGLGKGTFAEYAVAREGRLARKPPSLPFGSAAALPCAGVTALLALRDKVALTSGHSLLVNGASGGVGSLAVQIGAALGATVTGVCSTGNVELVASLGAHEVVDYTSQDFTRGTHRYDVVLDAVGNRSLTALRRATAPGGTLLLVAGAKGKLLRPVALMCKALVTSPFVGQTLRPVMATGTTEQLDALSAMVERGALRAVVDRTYALSDCAEAVAYVEDGHARGKVVVTA